MTFPSPFTSATPALDILQLLGYDESFYDESDEYSLAYGRKQNVYLCDREEPEVSFITPSLTSINTGKNDKTINPPIPSSSNPLWSPGLVEEEPVSSDKTKNSDKVSVNTIPFVDIEFSALDISNTSQDLPNLSNMEHNICIDLSNDKSEESSQIPPEKTIFPKKGESCPVVVIPQHLSRKQPLASSDSEDSTSIFKNPSTDLNRQNIQSINGARISQLSNEKERSKNDKENSSGTFHAAPPEAFAKFKSRIPSHFQGRLHKRKSIIPYNERQPFTDSLEGFDPYPDLY